MGTNNKCSCKTPKKKLPHHIENCSCDVCNCAREVSPTVCTSSDAVTVELTRQPGLWAVYQSFPTDGGNIESFILYRDTAEDARKVVAVLNETDINWGVYGYKFVPEREGYTPKLSWFDKLCNLIPDSWVK